MAVKTWQGEDYTEANVWHNNNATFIEVDNMLSAAFESYSEALVLGIPWCPTDGLDEKDEWLNTPEKKQLYIAFIKMGMALGSQANMFHLG